ncbi:ABC transporter substrate-binding protein, partial [Streptomyces sp. SM1]|uniref:ABC transporter substrate-binding protein n=1 Tax=Streptomyces sp. SM1 TaxID=402229 RepID=UPI0015E15BE4
ALLLTAGGATTAALLAARDGDAGGSEPGRPSYVLGVHSTSGPASALFSRPVERAARLAAAGHNADPDRGFDVAVRVLRDQGDKQSAGETAASFTADRDVFAVLGPVDEVSMRAAANLYGGAGLTHVSSTTGQQDYFVTSPQSSFQSGASHSALAGWVVLHALVTGRTGRLGVVLDRAGGTIVQDQGILLVRQWQEVLGGEVLPKVVAEKTDDGVTAVRSLLAAGVTAFAYLGLLDATVRAARQLAAAGFDGPRWMQHQLYGTAFPGQAGAAGEGWYVVTAAADTSALTTSRARSFAQAWRRRYGTAPEPYAAEAYDTVRMLLTEFARTVPAGTGRRPQRAALGTRMAKARYQGIARPYTFGEYHQYAPDDRGWSDGTFVHEVSGGRFVQRGSLTDLRRAAESPA